MQEYGIRNIIQGESSTINDENRKWLRQTFPSEVEDCFVGKEDELKRLLSLVVDEKQNRVISVWGMGGIGKTTIAKKVYNHDDTKRAFDSFAWVCITQQCQIRSVLEDVRKRLMPQIKHDISSLSNTELIEQLCQIQKVKRCMIVVDDLWEIDHWDGMKHALLVQGSKSKILVTTRKQKIAEMGLAFEVGLLSGDDGLELLKKKAFPQSNIPENAIEENLIQKVGKELVRKCGYLPLVISLLGGILSKKKSMREWELVNENINAYLYRGEGLEKEKELHGVLNLSYEDLPYYLKPCFLFLGLFKEDQNIYTATLYKRWIALGMIPHENQGKDETLMDIAELYLSELASRCIVQAQVEDAPSGQKYRSCKLHDVVRELCLSKGKEEDFGSQILNYQGGKFSALFHECLSGSKIRHLAVYFEREMELELERDELTITQDEDTSKHVQTLHIDNNVHGKKIEFPDTTVNLQKFKLLKVLALSGFKFAGKKLLRKISSLIHLRFLSLQQCELDELPSSIGNLVYLYNLDLLGSQNVQVPNVLRKMYRLKHLILPQYDKEKVGNYRLKLDQGLDQLETLVAFNTSVHELKSLARMKSLRIFAATVCDNENLLAITNVIATNWRSLRYCSVEIGQGCQFTTEEGLMSLKKVFTCHNLHELSICLQMGKLLEKLGNEIVTSELVSLVLFECEIEDDPMEILGKLPVLQRLFLLRRSFVGEEIKCHASGFPSLKYLLIDGLPNLREWKVDKGAMPILFEIEINDCPHLKMVPDGLRFINTLNQLKIVAMPELGKRLADEGCEDFHKIRHVPSIIIL